VSLCAAQTDAVVEALRAHDYAAAQQTLAGLPAGLERARAEVELLYHAGDLPAALRSGLAGLAAHPADARLAWRVGELAQSLHAAQAVERAAAGLARALERDPQLAPRESWERGLVELRRQAAALDQRDALARRALVRARTAVLACGALALVLLALFARGPRVQ